jgi:hypothetical protein
MPKAGLSPARRKKAARMIVDLRLNEHHHLRKRRDRLRLISEMLPENPTDMEPGHQTVVG